MPEDRTESPPGSAPLDATPASDSPPVAAESTAQEDSDRSVSFEPVPTAEEFEAVGEEERAVEEAASRPASGSGGASRRGGENGFLFAMLTLGVLLFFGWIGGTTILQLRGDLEQLGDRLSGVEEGTRRAELRRSRAALLRVRADLGLLKDALPEELAAEVGRAEKVLSAVSAKLEAAD